MTEKTTIALTRYGEANSLVGQALESLAIQKGVKADVFFLDQQEAPELEKLCKQLSNNNIAFHYIRIPSVCVSYARNQAIKLCETNIILFIDADAIAHKNWAYYLSDTLINHGAAVAGGKIIPKFHKKPSFLVKSNLVRDQYSLMHLGEGIHDISKVVATSMGLHIQKMGPEAYFNENMGRRDGNLAGGADIDVCERAIRNNLRVLYNSKAVVTHQVLEERLTFKWLFKRFYWGGKAKAQKVGRLQRTPTNPKNAWDYIAMPLFLIPFMAGFFEYKFSRKKGKL
ncbi:MAG: glycosyltransferase [Desulfobacterales bacterium]|nr:glycosyltransferase [Desulfobacterales bacterium]